MGKFDRRHSMKMRRRQAQVKKKLRAKKRADDWLATFKVSENLR